jgi:Leucine-rich repeat (LRR) protein
MSLEGYLKKSSHLYLSGKKITSLSGNPFAVCRKTLKSLYLHDNNIEELESLDELEGLTHLYLQNNRLKSIAKGMQGFKNLTKLYLNGNSISCLEGLEGCAKLAELHLSDQKLSPGVEMQFSSSSLQAVGRTLIVLTMPNAGITSLEPLVHLEYLQRLDVANNNIAEMKAVLGFTGVASQLVELDVRNNPVSKKKKYREQVIVNSLLCKLDGKEVLDQERTFLTNLQDVKQKVPAS